MTDDKSDIYAVGKVLYETLSGHKPFILRFLQDNSTSKMKDFDFDLPLGLQEIIIKSNRKDENERYQSAKEMADL